ncbi:hypothetical protein ACTNCH_09880 [Candidatus Merdisoma sp. HCP28S3_D10]|uniref:hypothetical protein n=1 Tax=unclassified Candidatus Merdisoma TaxID=3099611 RepID=UPI003F889FAC
MKDRKISLNINRKAVIIFLIVLFAAAAVVWAVFVALKKQESTGIADGAWYYAVDEKTVFPKGSSLHRKEDTTTVKCKGHEYSLGSAMIYEDKGAVMLFQNDMIWYDRETDYLKKVNYFTRMRKDGNKWELTKRHSKKEVSGGFLYDNGDLYVLLENAELTSAAGNISLDAGTVLTCTFNGDVQIIDANGGCTLLEQPGDNLVVTFSNGCYLKPLADTYCQANGTWRLLFTSMSMVPEL